MGRVCTDCPARAGRTLTELVDQKFGCALRCEPLAARTAMPLRWPAEYSVALVRRGIVLRQRVDERGRTTAIDIAGPGSALPLADPESASLFALGNALLCLCPRRAFVEASSAAAAGGIIRAQSTILRRVERLAEARGRAGATSRVAATLVAISEELRPHRTLSIVPGAIQQRDLAGLAGMRHESVCRALGDLEGRKLLRRVVAGLEIVDRDGLRSV